MNKQVLMIEDFAVMQKFYTEALEQSGYDLEIATDGEMALEKLAEKEYDVVLLDMLLPGLNGIEFLEKFSDRPEKTKILVLSDFTDGGRIERAKELGITAYLVKSEYPPSVLVTKLDEITAVSSSDLKAA